MTNRAAGHLLLEGWALDLPVDLTGGVGLGDQPGVDPVPGAVRTEPPMALRDLLMWPERVGQITPLDPGPQPVADPIARDRCGSVPGCRPVRRSPVPVGPSASLQGSRTGTAQPSRTGCRRTPGAQRPYRPRRRCRAPSARLVPRSPRRSATPSAAARDSRAASTSPLGASAGADSETPVRYRWLSRLPRTAMPNVPPTSRAASFTADATPCLLPGTAETMSVVAGAVASAMPAPTGTIPASSSQYDESAPSWLRTHMPTPMSPRPATARGRRLTRAARCGTRRDSRPTPWPSGSGPDLPGGRSSPAPAGRTGSPGR